MLRRTTIKLSVLILLVALILRIPITNAYYSDSETTEDNLFSSSSLDLNLTPDLGFSPDTIDPDTTSSREVLFVNQGELPFVYDQEFVAINDSALCGAVNLTVKKGSITVYEGLLADYYYESTEVLGVGESHDYTYTLSLPEDSDTNLVSMMCDFGITSNARQDDGVYKNGFWDEEYFDNTINSGDWFVCSEISGYKKDTNQNGLEGWEIVVHDTSKTPLQSIELASDDSDGDNSVILEDGKKYLFEVSGTWTNQTNRNVDASFWSDGNWVNRGDFDTDPTRDDKQLDVLVADQDVDWGTYNDDHLYKMIYEGDGESVNFKIYDRDQDPNYPSWYDDNEGSLTIKIYDITDEIILTDKTGKYEAEICGDSNFQILEIQREGWKQIEPSNPDFYHVKPGEFESGKSFDFINEDLRPKKIVINEVYYDVDNQHGSEESSQNDEWVELYNPNPFPVSIKKWTITDNHSTDTISNSQVSVPAEGFLVMAKDAQTWTYWNIPSDAEKVSLGNNIGNGLSNDGDYLVLKDSEGNIIDEVSWGSNTVAFNPSVPDVSEGHSISRKVKGVDTDTANDWMDTHPGSTPPGPNPGTNPHDSNGNLVLPEASNVIPPSSDVPSPETTPSITPFPTPVPTIGDQPTPTPVESENVELESESEIETQNMQTEELALPEEEVVVEGGTDEIPI